MLLLTAIELWGYSLESLLPFLPFLMLPIVFFAMRAMVNNSGPWSKLKQRYAHHQDPGLVMGERVSIPMVRLGMMNYKNLFRFVKTGTGLYMYPIRLMRSGVPGVMIPYSEFKRIERKKRFLFKVVRLDVGSFDGVTMEISERDFAKLSDKLDLM